MFNYDQAQWTTTAAIRSFVSGRGRSTEHRKERATNECIPIFTRGGNDKKSMMGE